MKEKINRNMDKRKLAGLITFTVLIAFIMVGFAKQDKFIYNYNFQRLKNSCKISDKIKYSAKAIKHSSTEEEVKEIIKFLQNREENIAVSD